MFLLQVALLLAVSGRLLSQEDAAEQDSNVLKLTLDNFDDTIRDNAVILVEFFAPW